MAVPPTRTALVTGACSGIGYALVLHLLKVRTILWRVVLADINDKAGRRIETELKAEYGPSTTLFICCDVTSFESNAAAFKTAFEWSNGRIDFFAANAGITDSTIKIDRTDLTNDPTKPNLRILDVNLSSVIYGFRCFLHYVRKARSLQSAEPEHEQRPAYHPKMVATASTAGLYKADAGPLYGASKAAVISFVRSISEKVATADDLCLNAICPSLVLTNIIPKYQVDILPLDRLTPLSTVMKAYDELIDGVGETRSSAGVGRNTTQLGKFGKCLEVSQDKLYYRDMLEYSDDNARWFAEESDAYVREKLREKRSRQGNDNKGPQL